MEYKIYRSRFVNGLFLIPIPIDTNHDRHPHLSRPRLELPAGGGARRNADPHGRLRGEDPPKPVDAAEHGERVHRFDYGCPIRRYLFEIMDISAQTLLRDEIERAVVLFEPRVALNRVDFEADEPNGLLRIVLDYTVRQTNRRTNMVYPFYLNEGTDLTGL